MKALSTWLAAVGLAALTGAAHAAPVVYTFNTFQDGTNTLGGSITVDDNGDGKVFASEITAWQFTATGDPTFSLSSVGTTSLTCLGANGCFSVASGALSFDFGSLDQDDPYFEVNSGGASTLTRVAFVNALKDGGRVQWLSGLSDEVKVSPTDDVVARDLAGVVPEPGSLALLGTALVACFGATGRRSRRRRTKAV